MIPIFAKPKRFPSALSPSGLRQQLIERSYVPKNQFSRTFSSFIDKQNFSSMQNINRIQKYYIDIHAPNFVQEKVAKLESVTCIQPASVLDDLYGPRCSNWWTGKSPQQSTYVNGKPHAYAFLSLQKGKCTRESIQKYFDNTWTSTEALFASLQGEEAFQVSPPHNLRHPLIFYYGHPAALYINKLRVAGLLSNPINPYFEVIFETGVDEMSWDDMSKNKMPWPKVHEVQKYRAQVYATVTRLISSLTDDECANINQNSPLWALVMSFEHERIHIETSSVLMAELPVKYLKFPKNYLPSYYPYQKQHNRNPIEGKDYPKNDFLTVESKLVKLGKSSTEPSFGWDNEYGERKYQLPSFEASQFKITNGEFYQFVTEGGYSNPEYWSKTGWQWRAYRNAKWPTFWQSVGPQGLHHYDLRVLFDVIPMQWSWPVVVNFHESEAFANWKSSKTTNSQGDKQPIVKYRIMSELEHNAIRDNTQVTEDLVQNDCLMKESMADSLGVNANMSYSSMSPVDAFPPNKNGFYDVLGNAWEWNIDYFSPLNNFKVHPYYEDFSTPCFDGLHNIIQGCSFISTGNQASIYSRYHFRPHFFQHASFRLVKQNVNNEYVTSDTDAPGPYVGNYPFRQSKAGLEKSFAHAQKNAVNLNVAHLMSKHFDVLPLQSDNVTIKVNGYEQMSKEIISLYKKYCNKKKAPIQSANVIDVGCGVGGLTQRLATSVKYVLGVDHDQEAVAKAEIIAKTKQIDFQLPSFSENHFQKFHYTLDSIIDVKKFGDSNVLKGTTEFRASDPMCLPAELHGFDIVVLNDVIDKVSSPNSILGRLGGPRGLTKNGGLLFVASAYQWNENRTPKDLWLNKNDPSFESSTEEALLELINRLAVDFEFLEVVKVNHLWRESIFDYKGKLLSFSAFKRKE